MVLLLYLLFISANELSLKALLNHLMKLINWCLQANYEIMGLYRWEYEENDNLLRYLNFDC